jgi:RHS repeat-associated protein
LAIDAGESPAVVRRDPLVQGGWGLGAPLPGLDGDHFNIRWSGYVSPDVTGDYVFGGEFDDALSVRVNGNLVYSRSTPSTGVVDYTGAVTVSLTAGSWVPIQVDYGESVAAAHVTLWAKRLVAGGSAVETTVPSWWLRPDAPMLPKGWQVSADLDGSTAYTRAQVSTEQVTIYDAMGTPSVWRSNGSTYIAPPGEDSVLTRDSDAKLTLHGEDGQTYVFNADGQLAAVTSALDDRAPAAPTYTWEGTPARLTAITDPVSGTVLLRPRYSGFVAAGQTGDGCPATPPTGTTAAPAGMLCGIDYLDGTASAFWYTNDGPQVRQLTRIVDPGGEITDLAYAAGKLAEIRDPLAFDTVAAGVRGDDATVRTEVAFDATGRAASVTLPAPSTGAARPGASYVYASPTTRVYAHGVTMETSFAFGDSGDKAVVGDWDGNGTTTIGVFRNGTWYLRNTNSAGAHDVTFGFGTTGDLPVAGDWDGNGTTTIGVFRPSNATFYLRNANSSGASSAIIAWGDLSDVPVVGDWDGNGTTTIGVFRPSTQVFYLRNTNSAGPHDIAVNYGTAGDTAVVGDWDGNGTTTIGVRRSGTTWYLRNSNSAGSADLTTSDVTAGTTPLAGDWDGSGSDTPGVFTTNQFTLHNQFHPTATVTYNATGQTQSTVDATGVTTSSTWDSADRPLTRTDPAGRVTTLTYDRAGRLEHTYGPSLPSVPLASRAHTQTSYDGGINGLAATFWDNDRLAGAPRLHKTVTNLSAPGPTGWGTGAADPILPADGFSARFSGEINFGTGGWYGFRLNHDDGARLWIDDTLIIDGWGTVGVSTQAWDLTGGGIHRIRVDYRDTISSAYLDLQWSPNNTGVYTPVPDTALTPRYGLVTSTTVFDSGGPSTMVTATAYAEPHLGLATSSTVDPAGLALTSTTTYEPHATVGSFLRRTASTLPAGAGSVNTYVYYGASETADDPCSAPVEAIVQAGRVKTSTAADPDGAGPETAIVREQRYDEWGRVVAARVGAEPWTCSTYDARGRVSSVVYPAFGGSPARTVTMDHAVGGNPLVASVTDPAGTVTTTVDLLGRVVASTDVWNKTTTTSYDQQGRVTQSVGPAGTLGYTYDPAGRVDTVRLDNLVVADPVYTSTGEVASVGYPSGAGKTGNGTSLSSLSRDPAGRLSALVWSLSGGVTVTDAVSRSQSGRVVDETIDGTDPYPTGPNFEYDTAGRLTTARVPGHAYVYGFAASGGCGVATTAGANSNRTSVVVDGGPAVTYCYDHADRLTSTTATGYTGAIGYDGHGNTTTIAGETRGYDSANRHLSTTSGATTVTYTRDALDRIVARNDGTTTIKYTPGATLDAAGNLLERTIPLPGGVLLTRRASSDVWSYPNIHGDIIATANASGTKQGATLHWGPNGETLTTIPDNAQGAFDHGWLGQHQRPLEHETGLANTIEMGARQYDPTLGRFLQTDPIEGGSCNDYDYVCGDSVGGFDLDGTRMCVDRDCHMSFVGRKGSLGHRRYAGRLWTIRSIYWNERVFHSEEINNRHNRFLGRMAPRIISPPPGPNADVAEFLLRAVCGVASVGSVASIPGLLVGAGGKGGAFYLRMLGGGSFKGSAAVISKASGVATVVSTAVDIGCRAGRALG